MNSMLWSIVSNALSSGCQIADILYNQQQQKYYKIYIYIMLFSTCQKIINEIEL